MIACATRISDVDALRAAGASHVFRPSTEIALGVLPAVYAALEGALPEYATAQDQAHGRVDQRAEVID